MAILENILSENPTNFKSMSNGEMITQVHGDKVFTFLKHNENIYTLQWGKQTSFTGTGSQSSIGSKSFSSGAQGWRIYEDGVSEFERVKARVSLNNLNWKFFTGTSAGKNLMVTVAHGVASGKKRIVCVSVNIVSDTSPNLTGDDPPTGSFIAGAGNIQDELDVDREFRTFYDDTNLYIITDDAADDVAGNQFTCAVFYADIDLY